MTRTTRCAIWTGGQDFPIGERPLAEPGPGEVSLRVHACGVCLTDVHYTDGLLGPTTPNLVLGHEWSGVIEATGPGVTGLTPGTPVAGVGQGGYAERMVVATNRVFPVPTSVPFERAAFVEPFAACLAAVKVASIPLGATVLVTGAGTMGLTTLQLALRSGAARAIVSEPNPARREQALRLGADAALDPREGSIRDAILAATSGVGVDVALETAGHPSALKDCLSAVADRGTIVLVGVHPVTTRIDFEVYPFHRHNLTLKGSYGTTGPDDTRAAVKWLGQLEFDSLITHRYPFSELTTAFAVARGGTAGKVMIKMA